MMVAIAWPQLEHHQIDKLHFEHFQLQHVLMLYVLKHKPKKNMLIYK